MDTWGRTYGRTNLVQIHYRHPFTSFYFHFMPILPWCMCKMWFGWRVTDLRRRRMLAGSGIQTAMSRLGCGKWWNVDVEDVELCRILGQMHGMLPEHTTGKKTLAPIGANKCSCKWVWSCWAVYMTSWPRTFGWWHGETIFGRLCCPLLVQFVWTRESPFTGHHPID